MKIIFSIFQNKKLISYGIATLVAMLFLLSIFIGREEKLNKKEENQSIENIENYQKIKDEREETVTNSILNSEKDSEEKRTITEDDIQNIPLDLFFSEVAINQAKKYSVEFINAFHSNELSEDVKKGMYVELYDALVNIQNSNSNLLSYYLNSNITVSEIKSIDYIVPETPYPYELFLNYDVVSTNDKKEIQSFRYTLNFDTSIDEKVTLIDFHVTENKLTNVGE